MYPEYSFFLGVTANLYDPGADDPWEGKIITPGGAIQNMPSYYTTGKLSVPQDCDTLYMFSDNRGAVTVGAFDGGGTMLAASPSLPVNGWTWKLPQGTEYVRVSVMDDGKRLTDIVAGRMCRPVYKDDLAVEYSQESGEQFFRPSLSGSLVFLRGDYDFISSQQFGTTFSIGIRSNTGGEWSRVFAGQFHKTDGEFTPSDRRVETKVDTRDQYADILAGIEDEYDLAKLAPEMQKLVLQKRPQLQMYMADDEVLTCYLAGSTWEQEVAEPSTNDAVLKDTYFFDLNCELKEILLSGDGIPDGMAGLYVGRLQITATYEWEGTLRRDGSPYRVRIFGQSGNYGSVTANYRVERESDGELLYTTSWQQADGEFDFTPATGSGMTATLHGDSASYFVYARYVLDVDAIGGYATNDLPSEDFVESTPHYRKGIGYGVGKDGTENIFYISAAMSDEPTGYAQADDGRYFAPPSAVAGGKFYPLAQSTWRNASVWFLPPALDSEYERGGRADYLLRDTYTLASCINVLLRQFAPSVQHQPTQDCSQFLYGSGGNPIDGTSLRLLVTQKTNVTRGEYSQAAQKAPVTLRAILDMLKKTYKCYWYVEGGLLKIEQVQFFRNGGSYSGAAQVGTDLTRLLNVRNGKAWDFASDTYKFDKLEMPERYEFAWMDEVSDSFEGSPINVLSPFVSKGKKEEVTVSSFTSDIDFMMLNSGGISEEGFALFAAEPGNAVEIRGYPPYISTSGSGITSPPVPVRTVYGGMAGTLDFDLSGGGSASLLFLDKDGAQVGTGGTYAADGTRRSAAVTVPYLCASLAFRCNTPVSARIFGFEIGGIMQLPYAEVSVGGATLEMQNGYLAFTYLQPTFWRYDMPASRLEINGEETTALSVEKKKTQDVEFPASLPFDTGKLVRTSLGDGQVKDTSIALTSLMAKTTLRYDTE